MLAIALVSVFQFCPWQCWECVLQKIISIHACPSAPSSNKLHSQKMVLYSCSHLWSASWNEGKQSLQQNWLLCSWSALSNTTHSTSPLRLPIEILALRFYEKTQKIVHTRCSLFSDGGWGKPTNTCSWRRPKNTARSKIQTSTFPRNMCARQRCDREILRKKRIL